MVSIFSPRFPTQPSPAGATVATTQFPTELAPFIKDILEKSKAQQEGAAYQAYTGPQLAQFTDAEKAAMDAMRQQTTGLAGTDIAQATPYFTGAKTAAEQLGEQFTGDTAQQFMNPYQQAVVDQAKRKAIEDYERVTAPTVTAQAIAQQPFGGSRQAIAEAMAREGLADRLTEIQERGLSDAFTQGRAAFEAQKARELQQAQQLAQLGQTVPQQALRDLAVQQQLGEQERQQEQLALDLAKGQFMEEREFPTRALQEYSAIVRGFPFQPSTYQTSTQYQATPSIANQLLQLGATGAGLYTQFGGKLPNIFGGATGGGIADIISNQMGENDQISMKARNDYIESARGDTKEHLNKYGIGGTRRREVEGLIPDENLPDEVAPFRTDEVMTESAVGAPMGGPLPSREEIDMMERNRLLEERDMRRMFNQGGLVTVYNSRADNEQNIIDRQISGGIPPAGVAPSEEEIADVLRQEEQMEGMDLENNLFNLLPDNKNNININIPSSPPITTDALSISTYDPNRFSDTDALGNVYSDNLVKINNLMNQLKTSQDPNVKAKLEAIEAANISDSKALEKLRQREGVLTTARERATELFGERGTKEDLERRKKEAERIRNQGIGAAILSGASKIDPTASFIQNLSALGIGTGTAAQPVLDTFNDFVKGEEDRELNAQLGLIGMETDLLTLENNLEKLQTEIDKNKLNRTVSVADLYLQDFGVRGKIDGQTLATVLDFKIKNANNKLEKEKAEQLAIENQMGLRINAQANEIRVYDIDKTYQGNLKKLISDQQIAAASRFEKMPKEATDAVKALPEVVAQSFGIQLDPNTNLPIGDKKYPPKLLAAYTKALMEAEAQIITNQTLMLQGVKNINYLTGTNEIAAKHFNNSGPMVGTGIAPYLSKDAIEIATTNSANKLGANSEGIVSSNFNEDINLLQTLDKLGGDITKLFDPNQLDRRNLPALEKYIEGLRATYPNYKAQ
ncbi:hypothetical protein [Hyphomonas sp.]|uniref:hypothetical protein n=1 Tax=Hyphomonas sp. TaxID=87 RepID=UPI000C965EA1|nr:hypothetical protein [Hyphomonas sp.]MAL46830.1 hypothetical protein [Hyphomonas sp.]